MRLQIKKKIAVSFLAEKTIFAPKDLQKVQMKKIPTSQENLQKIQIIPPLIQTMSLI
jgi:hypothetical protein